MKTIFDFVYCDGVLSPSTVFYQVRVGKSARDRAAASFVRSLSKCQDYLWIVHDGPAQSFIDQCAASLFPGAEIHHALRILRRRVVEVSWLASFLKKYPPCLLNSQRIDTHCFGSSFE